MTSLMLILVVTLLYACYNLLVKISTNFVPAEATSTVLATISLQVAALMASLGFLGFLTLRGGQSLALSGRAYLWAAAAGLCIGVAEICYFYVFRGGEGRDPVTANVAIPIVVSGTIALTLVASYFLLREPLTSVQFAGTALVVLGIGLIAVGSST